MAQEFQCPTDEIEKKITSIRAQFFRELGLVEAKKQSNGGESYSPKWYAFKKLQFLAGKSIARGQRQPMDPAKTPHFTKKKKNLKIKIDGNIHEGTSFNYPTMVTAADASDISCEQKHKDHVQGLSLLCTPKTNLPIAYDTDDKSEDKNRQNGDDEVALTHNKQMGNVNSTLKCKPSSTCTMDSNFNDNTTKTREEPRAIRGIPDSTFTIPQHADEFSIFGEYVATTLRKLSGQYLQCYAKHEISNILFYVEAQNCQPNARSNAINQDTIDYHNIPQQSLRYYDLTIPKSNSNQS
ncbi:uncharacterized protein LOC124154257 isoform X2 [Ischnura elegans]|nr:uncharacterized protein LOC124154257 isoform X2 [Ischnura elegans]